MTSPYLDKPLRTETEANFDVALHKLNVAARGFRDNPLNDGWAKTLLDCTQSFLFRQYDLWLAERKKEEKHNG